MWTLPLLIIVTTILLSFPFGRYLAWIMDCRYNAPRWLRWIEERLDTGPQSWKQYTVALMLFNTIAFVVGYAVLQAQIAKRLRQTRGHRDDSRTFAPGGRLFSWYRAKSIAQRKTPDENRQNRRS